MARIEWVKHRLDNWALWAAREQGGGLGFAGQSVLLRTDGDGQAAGSRIPIDEIEAATTDQAVSSLVATDPDLHGMLTAHYISGKTMTGVAQLCGVGLSTVYASMSRADRLLAVWFQARSERQATAKKAMGEAAVVPRSIGTPKRSFTS